MEQPGEEGQIQVKERERLETHKYLAPIEHSFIGSSAKLDGDVFNTVSLFAVLSENKLSSKHTTPPMVDVEGVEGVNSQREGKVLSGFLNLFNQEGQMDIMLDEGMKGYEPTYFVGKLTETGEVDKVFKFGVMNKKGELSGSLLDKLVLNESFSKYFVANRSGDYILVSMKDNPDAI